MSPVKRICVFEHSVMTNFNCACPAIQMRRLVWTFAARIGYKYQIGLTRSISFGFKGYIILQDTDIRFPVRFGNTLG